MSWDTSLKIFTGKKMTNVVCCGNCTYNLGNMFKKALGFNFSDLNGKRAGDVLSKLQLSIKDMRDNPDEYKEYNPDNGWGTYEGAFEYLVRIAEACENHPDATISIS